MIISRPVSDLPRTGKGDPSEEDMVPPPNTLASSREWWWLTMTVLASRSVSSRTYHSCVQRSTS